MDIFGQALLEAQNSNNQSRAHGQSTEPRNGNSSSTYFSTILSFKTNSKACRRDWEVRNKQQSLES